MAFNPFEPTEKEKQFNPFEPEINDDDNVFEAAYHGLAGATGNVIKTAGHLLNYAGKPSYISDEEWARRQGGGTVFGINKAIEDFGREMEEEHQRNYSEPLGANSIASGIGSVVPYAVALGLTARSGRAIDPAGLGEAAGVQLGQRVAPHLGQTAAKVTEAVVPGLALGQRQALPEALVEMENARNDYVENAKAQGQYKPGVTEAEAEKVGRSVLGGNLGFITGTDAAQNALINSVTLGQGSRARRALQAIGIGGGINAAQEIGQQIIPKEAKGEDWSFTDPDIIASGIIGGITGGLPSAVAAAIDSRSRAADNFGENAVNDALNAGIAGAANGKEAFINAIAGQESGGDYNAVNGRTGAAGKYQIMPENWPAWAEEAGLGRDAEMTPENQEIVARFKLGQYYDKYGARNAAIAWYGGEGAINYSDEAKNRKQGNGDEPSINEYADSIMQRMGESGTSTLSRADAESARRYLADRLGMFDDAELNNDIYTALENGKDDDIFTLAERAGWQPERTETTGGRQAEQQVNYNPEDVAATEAEDNSTANRIGSDYDMTQARNEADDYAGLNSEEKNEWRTRQPLAFKMPRRTSKAKYNPAEAMETPYLDRLNRQAVNPRADDIAMENQRVMQETAGRRPRFTGQGTPTFRALMQRTLAARSQRQQNLNNALRSNNLANLTARAMSGDHGARQTFDKLRPEVRSVLLNRHIDRLNVQNMDEQADEARKALKLAQEQQEAKDRAQREADKRELLQGAEEYLRGSYDSPAEGARAELRDAKAGINSLLQPIIEQLRDGMGNGVTLAPAQGREDGRRVRISNNAPWYQKWHKEHKRKPTQKELEDIARDVYTGRNSYGLPGWEVNQENEAEFAQNRATLQEMDDFVDAYEQLEKKFAAEPNGGRRSGTSEESNAGEVAARGQAETEQADNENAEAESELSKKAKEVVASLQAEDVNRITKKTNVDKQLIRKTKEELYNIALDDVNSKIGKTYSDPLNNSVYFAPGNTETVKSYTLHLIAGQNKPMEDIRVQRVMGLLLADETIKNPLAIVRQNNGRKMYLAMYQGENNMTNGLVIGVEEGQDGRVVTSTLTADKKGDKKAALREFKKRVSGADEVLYIWEGLTGRSRPSADQQASQSNAELHLSGDNIIPQNEEESKSGTSTYDGSTRPSTVTTNGLLFADTNNEGGDGAAIVHAKSDVPAVNVAQETENVKANTADNAQDGAQQAETGRQDQTPARTRKTAKKPKAEARFTAKGEKLIPQTAELRGNEITVISKPAKNAANNERLIGVELPEGEYTITVDEWKKAENGRLGNANYNWAKLVQRKYAEAFPNTGVKADTPFIAGNDPLHVRIIDNQITAIKQAVKAYDEKASADNADDTQLSPLANRRINEWAEQFGLDAGMLRSLIAAKPTESNINEYGRFSDLKASADKQKVKAFFDNLHNDNLPMRRLSALFDNYLRQLVFALTNTPSSAQQTTVTATQQQAEPVSRFDGNRAVSRLDELIGRKKPEQQQTGKKFMNVFDESELDAEIAKAKAEMSKLSANPFFNPALMKSLFKIGGIYMQRGVNNFADWSARMVDTLGSKVKPFLKSAWDALQAYPADVKFNDDIMTATLEFVGSRVDNGRTRDEIRSEFREMYGDEYVAYIDAAYEGVSSYPTEIAENADVVNETETQEEAGEQQTETAQEPAGSQQETAQQAESTERTETPAPEPAAQQSANVPQARFNLNEAQNGIEIKFLEKPSQEVLTGLKNAGFRWSRFKKHWYSKQNPRAMAFAESIGYVPQDVVQSNQEINEAPPAPATEPAVQQPAAREQEATANGNDNDADGYRAVPENVPAAEVQETESERTAERVREPEVEGRGVQVTGDNGRTVGERPVSGERRPAGESTAQSGTGSDSKGTSERGSVRALRPAQKKKAKASEVPGHNFTITADENIGKGGAKTKYKDNVAAIKLLKQLEAEDRLATPEEQKVLARYVGWGGLAPVFSYGRDSAWESEKAEIRELLTDEEYNAARASTNNAHYTSPEVIKGVWDIIERLGFKGGKVLEPSMGIGNFFGMMPEKLRSKSSLNGVELDSLTGRIAKQLYQKASVEINGYEKTKYPDNYFDLAISNVPFGDYKLHDPKYDKYKFNIHNYFFAKAIDQVRPGGLVAFITSTGTMQSGSDAKRLREILKDKADFIGAVRLPDTAFKENAGTEVTTDLIILQKREPGAVAGKNNHAWLDTKDSDVRATHGGYPLQINEYYADNPEMLIGKLKEDTLYYGGRLALDGTGLDVGKELESRVAKFPKNIYKQRTTNRNTNSLESAQRFLAPSGVREGQFVINENSVFTNNKGEMTELPKAMQARAKDYVGLREVTKKILDGQINPQVTDETLDGWRKDLNKVYDKFVAKHGYLNSPKNKRDLAQDPDFGIVSAIEKYTLDKKSKKESAAKADIFRKRTVNPIIKIDKADNPSDALALSLSNTGAVDIDYMAELTGQKPADIVKSLKGFIYKDPATNTYVTAEEYLSGNVRQKLELAEFWGRTDPEAAENVEALKKVQPVDLTPEEISVNLGTPWIPESDLRDFAQEMLGMPNWEQPLDIRFNKPAGTWLVAWNKGWRVDEAKRGTEANQKWGTSRRGFATLLDDALNQRTPTVYDTSSDGKRSVNQQETLAAQQKLREIQDEFKKWIWKDKDRADRLAAYYNRNFNNMRLREYNGSMLTLPGYSSVAPPLKQHQKDAVWRIIQDGTALLAHTVGAGKTWTMQTAAMELKRLGIVNKSMFVIPNHMLQQFENEFRIIYPNAKLLTISSENLPDVPAPAKKGDTAEAKKRRAAKIAERQKILSRIATEDWDGIIISHNMFKRIPMSPEAYNAFYQEQIDNMRTAIIELTGENDRNSNRLVKELEKKAKSLEERLKRDMNEENKDIVIPFEQLGIDEIFVDEADLFKNLFFVTKMNRIGGLSNTNSQRSLDMYMKTQYLAKHNNGRGIVFATGTPISNTMAEMFTMLRYLDGKGLKENDLDFFDNWAAQFAERETVIERSPDGQGWRQAEKFTKFKNMPELIKMFRKVADVKTQADLNLDIPKLKNGKPTVIEVEPNSALTDYIKNTAKERAQAIHDRQVDPSEDNMLKLTGDLRKASLDMRLIDPTVPESVAGGKLRAVAENVYKKYKESDSTKGAQLVFCDLSTPKGTSDKVVETDGAATPEAAEDGENVTAYEEIKKNLVKKGIPSEEIAFIHDAKTKEQKEELFAKVRDGRVRVLIGSTEKMGAGTNVQKKLVALHHVDAPWRPRDIEQREGRILRQGNENAEVEIFNYVTKDSFDANMWEKLKNKATMIAQALSNNLSGRTLEDADANVLSFAEIESLASGNPLVAERVAVNAELNKYEALYASYRKNQAANERKANNLPATIEYNKNIADNARADIKNRSSIEGDKFSITLGKKVFNKRADAKAALEAYASNKSGTARTVGKIGGFELRLRPLTAGESYSQDGNIFAAQEGDVKAELVGKNTYTCEATLGSIEHAVMHAPEKTLDRAQRNVESSEKELKAVQAEIAEPFKYLEKYEELKKRSAEIDKELGIGEAEYSATTEPAAQRSSEEVLRELQDALPNGKFEDAGSGEYTVTLPNNTRIKVNIADRMVVNNHEAARARGAHGLMRGGELNIEGSWQSFKGSDVDGLLNLSRTGRAGTAYHEVMHAAMDLALTAKEQQAMVKHFSKEAQATGKTVSEAISDGYVEWKRARAQRRGTLFGKLFNKMQDMLNTLKSLFTGVENAHNVMRRVESGEVWQRSRSEGKNGSRLFSLLSNNEQNKWKQYGRDFKANVQKALNGEIRGNKVINVCETPLILQELGIPDLPIKMRVGIAANTTKPQGSTAHAHELTLDMLRQIPEALNDPVFVMKSATVPGDIVVFTDVKNSSGNSVIVPLAIKKDIGNKNIANVIKSVYGKDNEDLFVTKQILNKNMLYANTEKSPEWLTGFRLQLPDLITKQSSLVENSITEKLSNVKAKEASDTQQEPQAKQKAESKPNVTDIQYSLQQAGKNFTDKIEVRNKRRGYDGFNLADTVVRSPSWLAERFPKFKLFFEYANKAMQKQEHLRSWYGRVLNRVDDILQHERIVVKDKNGAERFTRGNKVSKKVYDENKHQYQELLWLGDAEGRDFSRSELKEQGYSENVISAYLMVRQAMKKTYTLLNDARKQVQTYQKHMDEKQLNELKNNKFVEILSEEERDGGYLVAYKSPKMWEKSVTVSPEVLADLKARDTVQVLQEKETASGDIKVKYREVAADIHNRGGYIPHFFHEWFIMDKQKGADGKENYVVLGSARTQKEALQKAEKLLGSNKDRNIVIAPKQFSLDAEETKRAAVIGDSEFQAVASKLAKDLEMTTKEAKEFLDGKIKLRARHRFFGNFKERKGAKGFEDDLDWVLRHYFNSAARYVALEDFKPKAISLFERYFGRFDNDYSNKPLAAYVKDYINDINGNPSALETAINNMLNHSKWFRKYVASNFGDRAALQLASSITGKTSILKLGFMNFSSAFLNMTQLINTIGLTGSIGDVTSSFGKAINPGATERRIFAESGILNDIGMDSSGGYSKFRPGALGSKSMYLFRQSDILARKVTVLAGYKNGRKKGMSHAEAINYAKDINRKANFDYSVADAPNVFRRGSILAQLALQFKKYPIKELELMYELAKKGSLAQNAKFWGTYFLIAGLLQFPAAEMFDDLFKELFGESPRNEIKKAIFEATGDDPVNKKLGEIAVYGIGAAANVDLSRRAGLGDVNPAALPAGLGEVFGGPAYSTIKQAVSGLPALMQGDALPVIKALSPAVGNYVQALQGYSEGRRGRKTTVYENAYDQILKAAGFRSIDESKAYDVQAIITEGRSKRVKDRAAAIDKAIAKLDKGEKLSKDDIAELKELRVTGKQLRAERAKKRADSAGRLKQDLSKAERKEYNDLIKSLN